MNGRVVTFKTREQTSIGKVVDEINRQAPTLSGICVVLYSSDDKGDRTYEVFYSRCEIHETAGALLHMANRVLAGQETDGE